MCTSCTLVIPMLHCEVPLTGCEVSHSLAADMSHIQVTCISNTIESDLCMFACIHYPQEFSSIWFCCLWQCTTEHGLKAPCTSLRTPGKNNSHLNWFWEEVIYQENRLQFQFLFLQVLTVFNACLKYLFIVSTFFCTDVTESLKFCFSIHFWDFGAWKFILLYV